MITEEMVKRHIDDLNVNGGVWRDRVRSALQNSARVIAQQVRDEMALSEYEEAVVRKAEAFFGSDQPLSHGEKLLVILRRRFPKPKPVDPVSAVLAEMRATIVGGEEWANRTESAIQAKEAVK